MSQQFPTIEGKNNSIIIAHINISKMFTAHIWTHKTYESQILDEKQGFSDQLFITIACKFVIY